MRAKGNRLSTGVLGASAALLLLLAACGPSEQKSSDQGTVAPAAGTKEPAATPAVPAPPAAAPAAPAAPAGEPAKQN